MWKFKRNQCRPNVAPVGQATVESDLFGLTRTRTGWYCDTVVTRNFAPVAQLLNLWLTSRLPYGILHEPWTWSSITINWGYACKRHRDGNNVGPSIIRAFGTAQGGQLLYWPNDDHVSRPRGSLDDLVSDQAMQLNIYNPYALTCFNGNKAHETLPFEGEDRFSIIFSLLAKQIASAIP